jgi:hypothetical protein
MDQIKDSSRLIVRHRKIAGAAPENLLRQHPAERGKDWFGAGNRDDVGPNQGHGSGGAAEFYQVFLLIVTAFAGWVSIHPCSQQR